MARPHMNGGYTFYPSNKKAVYWTCGHECYFAATGGTPSIACPTCAAMTDTVLEEFIKTKKLLIDPVLTEYN